MRNAILATLVLVLGGVLAFAGAGYFAAGSYQNIPAVSPANPGCGATFSCNPGPAVDLLTQFLPAGEYVITARVDGQSYSPKSGATCFFQGAGVNAQNTTLNTSSDWSVLAKTTAVMLSKTSSASDATLKLSCQRGYGFEGASQMKGTWTIVQVNN